MKLETAELLEKYHSSNRLKFVESEKGLELEYELSDEEKLELVHSEYGKSLTATVDELFVAIIKKLVKLAEVKAKQQLSEF